MYSGSCCKDHSGYSLGKMLAIEQSRSEEIILLSHIQRAVRMGQKCPDSGAFNKRAREPLDVILGK